MSCTDTTAHLALEQLFLGELSEVAHLELREHARTCAECHEAYDRLTRVEAQLEKSRSGLPAARMKFLESQVLSRAAAQKRAAQARADAGGDRSLWTRVRLWLVPAGGLALAGVLALMLLPKSPPPGVDADGFQARGAGAAAAKSIYGVRAFCIQPEGAKNVSPKVLAEAGPGETLTCAVGNRVQFAYTAPKDARLTLAAPTPAGDWLTFASRIEVKKGTDVPLSFSTPVTTSWLSQPIEVKARFEDPATGKLVAETTLKVTP